MAKFVPDVQTQRWVVIAPGRQNRPSQVPSAVCPFCLGNENLTPPEISRVKNGQSWLVRVVPNKYPVTDLHEVIIHSPDHRLDLLEMPLTHVEAILKVYQERYQALSALGQVLIFNNKGVKSGESLLHPHSQVAVFPRQIKLDVLALEPVRNVVFETDFFVSFCPDFSQWPYEVWLALKRPAGDFGQTTDSEIKDLAGLLQKILRKLLKLFPDLSYNFYFKSGENWYLRIIPRIGERAGLELGTGLSVNWIDPEKAAEDLKK